MGFIPREVIPGLPEESQRELYQLQLELQRALQQLGVGTKLSELRAVDYFAAPYERVRVTVPSAGLTVILPKASAIAKDAWVEVLTEVTAGTLTVESVDGQVNGAANVTSTSLGALLFLSNGVDGWYSAGGGGGAGAPIGAGYIVDALDGTLTNERVLSGASGTTVDVSAPGAAVVRLATIAAFRILANMTAGVAVPTAQPLDTILNTLVSNTVGALAYRDLGGGWLGLNPGATAGHVLTSNGVGANPSYQAAGALSLTAQSYAGNPTGAPAAAASIAVSAESIPGRTSGNLGQLTSAVQTALIRAAGSLFFAAAAAGQHLRRSIAGGDLGFSALEVGAQGTPITANAAATNATTNLSCCTFTIPAGALVVGSTFRLTGRWVFAHTAAATPTLTAELLVNGAVVATGILSPQSTATTYSGESIAVFTIRTTGAGGTAQAHVRNDSSASLATVTDGSTSTATFAIDTTVSRSIELRIRMTTAVASNTLTVTNGYVERLS